MKERRGAGLLLIGALLMLGVTSAVLWWATHRDQQSTVLVFHWVPGPAPLKILGTKPYYNHGEDIAGTLDPRLLDLLRERAIGGELRMVTDLHTEGIAGSHAGALLFRNAPTAPVTLALVDRRAALYVEQGSGFAVFPEKSPALGVTIVLTPDVPLSHFTFVGTLPKGASSAGYILASWW